MCVGERDVAEAYVLAEVGIAVGSFWSLGVYSEILPEGSFYRYEFCTEDSRKGNHLSRAVAHKFCERHCEGLNGISTIRLRAHETVIYIFRVLEAVTHDVKAGNSIPPRCAMKS